VTKSSGYPAMDEAARAAISKCAFTPATVQGKPEQTWAPIMYVWKIE
jgi:TonB family protein